MVTSTETSFSKEEFKKEVVSNCKSLYRKNIDEADKQQVFQRIWKAMQDLVMVVLEDLQHVFLILLQHLNILHMAVVSDISMVCSNRR